MRFAVAALVLANVLFFAWTQGWLAPALPPLHAGQREPQRLAAQLRPELLAVLPPQAASAAVTAARAAALVCLEAGPLADGAETAAAEAALAAAALPAGAVARTAEAPPVLPWVVLSGRFADAAVRSNRAEALRRLDLQPEPLDGNAEVGLALVLSRHADRDAAASALAALQQAQPPLPVRTLRVVLLPPPAPRWWLRLAAADAAQQAALAALPAAAQTALAGGFKPCAVRS